MSFANETDESYEYEELLQEPDNCKVFVFEYEKDIFLLLNSSWLTIIHFQCGVKGSGSGGNDYIYNGQEAEEHAHPWQVKKNRKLYL